MRFFTGSLNVFACSHEEWTSLLDAHEYGANVNAWDPVPLPLVFFLSFSFSFLALVLQSSLALVKPLFCAHVDLFKTS